MVESDRPMTTDCSVLAEITRAWKQMMETAIVSRGFGPRSPSGQSWGEAFWRTLIGDIVYGLTGYPVRRAQPGDGEEVVEF